MVVVKIIINNYLKKINCFKSSLVDFMKEGKRKIKKERREIYWDVWLGVEGKLV